MFNLHRILFLVDTLSAFAKVVSSTADVLAFTISILMDGKPHCNGLLISLEQTISTCHCVGVFHFENFFAIDPQYMILVGGNAEDGKQFLQQRQVNEVIIHPNCTDRIWAWEFDYSVLTVADAFLKDDTLQPMLIPFQNSETYNKVIDMLIGTKFTCLATGRKDISSARKGSATSSTVTVLSWGECLDVLCSYEPRKVCESFKPEAIQTKFCAAFPAPLEYRDPDGTPIICAGFPIGLVSKSVGSPQMSKPRVVVRLDYSLGFLKNIFRNNRYR